MERCLSWRRMRCRFGVKRPPLGRSVSAPSSSGADPSAPTAGISRNTSVALPVPSLLTWVWLPGCPLGMKIWGWSNGAFAGAQYANQDASHLVMLTMPGPFRDLRHPERGSKGSESFEFEILALPELLKFK